MVKISNILPMGRHLNTIHRLPPSFLLSLSMCLRARIVQTLFPSLSLASSLLLFLLVHSVSHGDLKLSASPLKEREGEKSEKKNSVPKCRELEKKKKTRRGRESAESPPVLRCVNFC